MAGFFSKKQYAAIADKELAIKLLKERCLECSICTMFFNSSLTVLHVVFNLSDKLYAIKEKILKQSLTDISLVCTQFSFDVFQELTLFQWFPVIHISGREHKIENLTLVIDYQMQLESEEPSH